MKITEGHKIITVFHHIKKAQVKPIVAGAVHKVDLHGKKQNHRHGECDIFSFTLFYLHLYLLSRGFGSDTNIVTLTNVKKRS